MSYKYINLDYLDLMSDGDNDMKKVLIDMLLEEVPEEIKKMDALHRTSDWKQLKEVSHKLKSTLAFLGNEEMVVANQEIEHISKEVQNIEALPDLINTLMTIYPHALEELKQVSASGTTVSSN